MPVRLLAVTFAFAFAGIASAQDIPRSLDPRLKIELFAEQPTIATPTGIDVDHAGRVWAIESNTHFPPEGYSRHNSDRIWVMQDTDGDGKADKVMEFADGLTHTMSIAVRPVWLEGRGQKSEVRGQEAAPGEPEGVSPRTNSPKPQEKIQVFVATRAAIYLLHDDDGDLHVDRRETLVRLETAGNYPHNGLAGFAFDALGWMYFGFGENLGADYKIIGSDGTTLSGGGEGGNLYRCRPDGSELKQWATGFWNPHASCVDAFGRLFTVDNDPDSRPPCRLLHIIPGGDYGFRFRNGRKGLHPFTSWNGEIPGTLPMVAGTGEAPSGIVAYESDGLPPEYIGDLLVTSWGDHRIDRFRLKPKGASFESLAETIIQGGEEFRPVGIAVAPDGSLFVTDWVKRDYKLHGHGRIWRISQASRAASATGAPQRDVIDVSTITAETPVEKLRELLKSPRLEVRRTAAEAIRTAPNGTVGLPGLMADESRPRRARLEACYALYRAGIEHINALESDVLYTIFDLQSPSGSPERLRNSATADYRDREEFARLVALNDPFVLAELVALHTPNPSTTIKASSLAEAFRESNRTARERLAFVLAARGEAPVYLPLLEDAIKDPSHEVRRAAVQWAAEQNVKVLRPQVEKILDDPAITTDLFLSTLAAFEMLDGVPPQDFDKTPASKYVLPLLKDSKRSPAVRAQALRLVDPNDAELKADLLGQLLNAEDPALKLETVRTLQLSSQPFVGGLLLPIATADDAPISLRADAVSGLTGRWSAGESAAEVSEALKQLALSAEPSLQLEAVRASRNLLTKTAGGRGTRTALVKQLEAAQAADPQALGPSGALRPVAEQLALALTESGISLPDILSTLHADRPASLAEWYDRVREPAGDAAAGRRVFFDSQGVGCGKCHTVNGRGARVGPDLSVIARTMDRKKLAESILEPSKEISPQYTAWTFVMESGQVHTGMLLGDTRNNVQQIGTPEGRVVDLKTDEIELRQPQEKSLMPAELVHRMTAQEFRDLLAYLETLK